MTLKSNVHENKCMFIENKCTFMKVNVHW
jgi:hypothetical protein